MSRRKWTVVFDLDGSLETPYFDKEDAKKARAWLRRHPCGSTFDRMYAEVMDGLPHFLLNGALELLRWAVTHLKLYGYLPIQERKSGSEEGGNYYDERHTRGEIRFESCMSVIRRYLRECFRLDADTEAVEVSPEHWTIPIRPLNALDET